ncbi:integrase catalytic domain-containing protein [Nephila pilipes]|uniref:Integrase catalytic domain-containing protein n=1 Tax=Nephila pilipes TaxID=299642 RepID=A0A8X6R0M2_NEPPI|nr:integrase catalytic domain-containing protein [Nephila pilipes]
MIDKHLYMDDFLASTETETHVTMQYHEMKYLMTLMKLPMEKTSFCVAGDKPLAKRWLLCCIASCYDPLGLFSPFTIIGKILFQDTWVLGIKWDELLPTDLSTMWYAAVKQLDDICSIKISCYIGISSHTTYTVHVFCDASEHAYGSILYDNRNTSPPLWRHCPGTQNPADHLSRGILPSKLSNLKNWWHGPHWLKQEPSLWPTEDLSSYDKALFSRWNGSSWKQPSFTYNIKDSTLQSLPKEQSDKTWCQMEFAPLSAGVRHPLLLEGNHPFVLLLIKNTHVPLHHLGTKIVLSELRSDFWILQVRQAIKKLPHKRLSCKLSKSKCGNQIEGPLPFERGFLFPPLVSTLLDLLYMCETKVPQTQHTLLYLHVLLTRAVHIKLVFDLSTDKFLLA